MNPIDFDAYLKAFTVPGGAAALLLWFFLTRQQTRPGPSPLEADIQAMKATMTQMAADLREMTADLRETRERLIHVEAALEAGSPAKRR